MNIGQEKIKVMKDRILKINPEINGEIYDAKKYQMVKKV